MNRLIAVMVAATWLVAGLAWGQPSANDTGPSASRSAPAPAVADPTATRWQNARELTVEGRGWTDTEGVYDRLPARARETVPGSVWGLSRHSAGLCVRFVSDARSISARWTVTNKNLAMEHMPATGVSGLDLYVKDGAVWRWIGAGRPRQSPTNECVLVDGIPDGEHEYSLYLPLYNGTAALEIGVTAGARLAKALPRPGPRARPICVYGTSIVQGGCASRPGMAHVAILGRKLDWATVNLGFSGSGKMEPALADLLGEIDAAVYVLDCLPNMSVELIQQRVVPFVERLRRLRPDTPVVLVENVMPQSALYFPARRADWQEKNRALREAYERLIQAGTRGLTYAPADQLLGADGEAAVDGVHPTDLGFLRMAEGLEPILRKVLPTE